MAIATLIYGAGSVGPFASRAFVPAFITCAVMRFAPQHAAWFSSDMIRNVSDAPSWFTSDTSLMIFGLLALLEIVATKSPDLRAVYQEVDKYAKSLVAVVTYMGIASTQDIAFLQEATRQAGFLDTLPALMIGAGVFWVSSMRAGVMEIFSDADDADDAGVQGLFSWAEDVWGLFGPVLLILFPIIMIGLIALVVGLLALARKRARVKEEKSKPPCTNCGEMIYGSAVACFSCKTPVAEPRALGFLGQSKPEPAPDIERHPYRLVEKKRCPVCATRLEKRAVHQTCTACGHELMKDPAFAQAYIANIAARLPVVLGISFLFSLVPVVGLIPGVIYYRLALIAPFRRYIPRGRTVLLRWGVRLLFFFLIMFQWIPAVGGLVIPVMALVNYSVYRAAFKTMLDSGA